MADIEVRGELLQDSGAAVFFRSEDGVEAWLPRDQVAVVHDVSGVVLTMPEKLAKTKGIY